MKFKEYLENHCGSVGVEFWKAWQGSGLNGREDITLTIAIKADYTGQIERYSWTKKYCEGRVLFSGSWILFEYEEDSVLYAMKWL